MSLVTQLTEEILQHLHEDRFEIGMKCERCHGTWELAGPFQYRHPFACPECGREGIINLERQAERMVVEMLDQLEPPGAAHAHGHAPAMAGSAAGKHEGCGCGSGGCGG